MKQKRAIIAAAALAAAVMLRPTAAPAAPSQDEMLSADTESPSMPERHVSIRTEEDLSKKLILPLGPLYIQKSPGMTRVVLFPLFFHDLKTGPGGRRFTGLFPFYTWRNDDGNSALVVFPLLWNFNLRGDFILLVPPLYVEKKEGRFYRLFIAPALFVQTGKKVSFQFIPPVFFNFSGETRKFTTSLLFYRWSRGENNASGILPLVFWGENEGRGYSVVFPLFWRFSNTAYGTSKTVLPPFYYVRELEDWKAGFVPILFANRTGDVTQATLLPLFHLRRGKEERSFLLATPLGWYVKNESKNARGGGLLLVHLYRSDEKNVTVVAPFYFHKTVPDLMQSSTLVFPFVYHGRSPVYRNLSILGLVWDFHAYHEHRTYGVLPLFMHSKDLYRDKHLTWVLPTIQYQKNLEDWRFYIHPLFYLKGGSEKKFSVFFPLWWRFSEPKKLRQVFFPLFWDFKNLTIERRISVFFPLMLRYEKEESVHTAFLLFYHWKGMNMGRKSWKFAMLPAFGFGRTEPDDYYWKILFGLVGYERSEGQKNLYLFWLPVKLK
jgi:hypothetical protein